MMSAWLRRHLSNRAGLTLTSNLEGKNQSTSLNISRKIMHWSIGKWKHITPESYWSNTRRKRTPIATTRSNQQRFTIKNIFLNAMENDVLFCPSRNIELAWEKILGKHYQTQEFQKAKIWPNPRISLAQLNFKIKTLRSRAGYSRIFSARIRHLPLFSDRHNSR